MKKMVFGFSFILLISLFSVSYGFKWFQLSGEKGNILSISATSSEQGFSVINCFDNSNNTYWMPKGDPLSEGVTVRFTEPVELESLMVRTDDPKENFSLEVFADGSDCCELTANQEETFNGRKAATLFFRISQSDLKKAHITEIKINEKSKNIKQPLFVPANISATSVLDPKPAYAPEQLFDGRIDFGWAEGVKSDGENEAISVDFEKIMEMDSLYIANGYQRSETHFKANNRVMEFEVTADNNLVGKYQLQDIMGYQKINLNKTVKAKTISLKVISVYKGTKYKDLVLSELKFGNKGQVIDVQTDYFDKISKATIRSSKNNLLSKLLDKYLVFSYSNYDKDNTLQIKLRSNGSFVFWYNNSERKDSKKIIEQKVMDGNWLVDQSNKDRAQIKIFGKMHTTSEQRSYEDAYGDPNYQDQTKIFSDNLTIKLPQESDFVEDSSMINNIKKYIKNSSEESYLITGKTIFGIFPAKLSNNQ